MTPEQKKLLDQIPHNPHCLLMTAPALLQERKFVHRVLLAHEDAYEYLPHWYQDMPLMSAMLRRFPSNFPKLPEHLRLNVHYARAAVEGNPQMCAHVFANTPDFENLMLLALEKDASCYALLHPQLQEDPAFALHALRTNPVVYGHLPLPLQRTRALAQCALDAEPSNILAVMAHFGADRELMLQGFRGYPKSALLARADESLRSDPTFMHACAQISAQSLSKVAAPLRAQLDALVASAQAADPLSALRYLVCAQERAQLETHTPAARRIQQSPKAL